MTQTANKSSGFTIVELIIVITVIGILSTIGLISYSGYRTRAAKTAVESTVQQVKLKMGEYYTDKNKYPLLKTDVTQYLNDVGATSAATEFSKTVNSTDIVYTPKAQDGTTTCTATTPVCAKYTITVAPAYWGGASGDPSISVTQ
jgi:prepilin-type N-terminal cleavage/methylation domain-containing protein